MLVWGSAAAKRLKNTVVGLETNLV